MHCTLGVIVFYLLILTCSAGPTQISVGDRNFRNDVNIPSMHMTLLSIEDRLKSLENAVEGKMELYGRKLDNIEKDLSRFQVFMRMELDKISENISNKNYKDDFVKDRTIRKIETVYERINHKLGNIEGQIEITNMKSENTRGTLLSKFEKMEDGLTIRDADLEAELAETAAAVEDLKTTCTSLQESVANTTRDILKGFFRNTEKTNKKQHVQIITTLEETNKSLTESFRNVQSSINLLVNETTNSSFIIQKATNELDESLNDYANKITDMYSDLWKKTDDTNTVIENLGKTANLTRSEQQNGLRALMVQIGRKTGKNVQSDSSLDSQKLTELSQKIDSNFENIMLAQNLFLESCHRVQMDESQIETQISVVLNKLIDVFHNKTSVGLKDIEQLEQLIRTHDSNTRRSIYHVTNTLLSFMQKATDNKAEILNYINSQRLQLDSIYVLLQHTLSFNDTGKIQNVLDAIQDLQRQLNEIYYGTETSRQQINVTNTFLDKLFHATQDTVQINNLKLKHVFEFVKNIYHILTSIEMKVNKSYLDYYFNKYNIEAIAHRFGKRLHEYIKHADASNIPNSNHPAQIANATHQNISEIILEIFGEHFDEMKNDPYDDYPYTMNSSASRDDEEIVFICINNTNNCAKLNSSVYLIVKQNESEDTSMIKSNGCENQIKLNLSECTVHSELLNRTANLNSTNENKTSSTGCLPDYVGLIDVRSNYDSNCSSVNLNSDAHNGNDNITYDIDVRYSSANMSENSNNTQNGTETINEFESTTVVDQDVRSETETTTPEDLSDAISTTHENQVIMDESYISSEDDLADSNQEFEYTNHEYP